MCNYYSNNKRRMCTINCLADDNLINIFSYLDFRSRQRCALVCKRWKFINWIMCQSIRRLIYCLIPPEDTPTVRYISNGLEVESSNISDLGWILNMIDGKLQKLHVRTSYQSTLTQSEIPLWVCQLLNQSYNLNSLGIDYEHNFALIRLIKCIPTIRIKHLLFDFNDESIDSELALQTLTYVMLNAPQLVTLHIINPPVLTSWRMINEISHLRGLYIIGGMMHQFSDIMNIFELEIISLYACHNIRENFITALIRNCRNLHTVEISHCPDVQFIEMKEIVKLPHLRYLVLPFINDEILNDLSNIEEIYSNYYGFHFFLTNCHFFHFLRRSRNLKKFNFHSYQCNKLFFDLATKLGMNVNLNNNRMLFYTHWDQYFSV